MLKNSNLKAFCKVLQGSNLLLRFKNLIFFSNKNLILIGIKLNNKIYTIFELNKLIEHSYLKNFISKINTFKSFFNRIKLSK